MRGSEAFIADIEAEGKGTIRLTVNFDEGYLELDQDGMPQLMDGTAKGLADLLKAEWQKKYCDKCEERVPQDHQCPEISG